MNGTAALARTALHWLERDGDGLQSARSRRAATTTDALAAIGMTGRFSDPALMLSPFDHVRVLIARALAHGHRHILVRELDGVTSPSDTLKVLALLRALSRRCGRVMIVTPAEVSVAIAFADRFLRLAAGRQLRDYPDAPPSASDLDRHLA